MNIFMRPQDALVPCFLPPQPLLLPHSLHSSFHPALRRSSSASMGSTDVGCGGHAWRRQRSPVHWGCPRGMARYFSWWEPSWSLGHSGLQGRFRPIGGRLPRQALGRHHEQASLSSRCWWSNRFHAWMACGQSVLHCSARVCPWTCSEKGHGLLCFPPHEFGILWRCSPVAHVIPRRSQCAKPRGTRERGHNVRC